MRFTYVLPLLLLGCAEPTDDASDSEAETAPDQPIGKADTAAFAGLYTTHATTHKNGDITTLDLSASSYVRSRCYHTNCALELPETDAFDTYTSSAGKTYVRFKSFEVTHTANDELDQKPVVADVYEIKATTSGLKLRKSYTSRWLTLYKTTAKSLCTGDGGSFASSECSCPGNTPGAWPNTIFVAGAGGCIATPGASEDGCDTSGGLWTDDDATAIGSYCACGIGRYDDAAGSCSAI